MKNKILTIAALSLLTVACTKKVDTPDMYGELSVTLSGEPTVEVVSKAAETLEPTDPEAAGYMVRIYDSAEVLKYESSYSDFEAQKLLLGDYYVTAEDCSEAAAEEGKGKMRLYGRSDKVSLTADALFQTATVNCNVVNAKVSVQFDESVKNRFTGLQVSLSGGTTREKPIVITETETGVVTETWFNPSQLTYTISGTFSANGINKAVEITKTRTLQAKDNLLLMVKVNLDNGQLMPSLKVDTQINDLTEVPEEFNPYL
ncbi:MAG: DUF4493 domain-containing protein [Bacteroidales bacterium]|nr:DUF4493 domain-containing protein [Bacteroidales bacterium]